MTFLKHELKNHNLQATKDESVKMGQKKVLTKVMTLQEAVKIIETRMENLAMEETTSQTAEDTTIRAMMGTMGIYRVSKNTGTHIN